MPAAAGRLAGGPRARTICLLQTNISGRLALMGLTPHKEGDETMRINNLTLQRIKEAASIVDVIGDFYDLRAPGGTLTRALPAEPMAMR